MKTKQNESIYDCLERINWIIVDLSHPGNLGAAARAIKVMGGYNLKLVNPRDINMINDERATSRAAGGVDLLKNATCSSFDAATEKCNHVVAFTSRKRKIQPPRLSFHKMVETVVTHLSQDSKYRVSMVFGGERNGLTNENLLCCTHICEIESNPDYPSLNLSHAIQIVTYAIRAELAKKSNSIAKKRNTLSDNDKIFNDEHDSPIQVEKIFKLKKLFLDISAEIGLNKNKGVKSLESRVNRILLSTNLSETDFRILQSFLALIKKKFKKTEELIDKNGKEQNF